MSEIALTCKNSMLVHLSHKPHTTMPAMTPSEQMAKSIAELPEEAQSLLIDFIEVLRRRYSKVTPQQLAPDKSVYEAFEESGLIGCASVGDGLSANYKQVLTESLEPASNDQ